MPRGFREVLRPPPPREWRYHCEPCLVEWKDGYECWVCGRTGTPGPLPARENLAWTTPHEVKFNQEED